MAVPWHVLNELVPDLSEAQVFRSTSSLKVLHVVPTVGGGGAERILTELIKSSSDVAAHQIVSMTAGEPFFEMDGIEITSLGIERGRIAPRAVLAFRDIVRRSKPDILHAWLYHGNFLSCFARDLAVPIVWSIHNTDLPSGKSKPLTRVINRASARLSRAVPKRIVYAAEAAREIHEALGYNRRRGIVIANGVDLNAFAPDDVSRQTMRAALSVGAGERLIGAIGRFDPQKDHQNLIRSFARLRQETGARLVIAGSGCDASNATLQGYIRESRLEFAVCLLGPIKDVAKLLNGLDALVIASRYGEALPVVALEAAAIGIPIAATDVGDIKDLLLMPEHLSRPGDPASLAAAIEACLQYRDRSFAQPAEAARRQRLVDRYSLASMTKRYLDLYHSILIR